MLGYQYCAQYFDEEIMSRLENKPYARRTEEENIEYRSMQLAHWETSGYPDWPENLVEQGVAKVEHKNVLNSVFWLPLRYLTAHLNNEPNPGGPLVIQEDGGAKKMGSKIRLTVHDDRIAKRDLDEIIEIDRWDMS
jgi:hypothetical protein